MPYTALEVSDMETGYDGFKIKDVDFRLTSGDIMALVGKSGSGKSTLIKTLLGIKQPDKGEVTVLIDGMEHDLRDRTGYSSQENSLYDSLTVGENLKTFGKMRGLSAAEIEERMDDILENLGIPEARDKRVDKLSGGMAKRADIAVSTIHDPDIIVFDEPFTGIDPPQRKVIWESIERMADSGKVVIVTSHLLRALSEKCNSYGLLYSGRFYGTDRIEEIMQNQGYKDVEKFLEAAFQL